MENFATIVNDNEPLTIVAKLFILVVFKSSVHALGSIQPSVDILFAIFCSLKIFLFCSSFKSASSALVCAKVLYLSYFYYKAFSFQHPMVNCRACKHNFRSQ